MYEKMKYSTCLMFTLETSNFHCSLVVVFAAKLSQVWRSYLVFFAFLYPIINSVLNVGIVLSSEFLLVFVCTIYNYYILISILVRC